MGLISRVSSRTYRLQEKMSENEVQDFEGKVAAGYVVYKRNPDDNTNEPLYLIMKASYGNHHWSPPKGHVDPGENVQQTAFRETVEESGLEEADLIVDAEFEHTIFYPVKGKLKKVVYFLAETKVPE